MSAVRQLAQLSREYPQLYVDCLEHRDAKRRTAGERPARWLISSGAGALIALALGQGFFATALAAAAFAFVLAPRWQSWRERSIAPLAPVHPEMLLVQRQMLDLAGGCDMDTRRLQSEVALARLDLPRGNWLAG